MKVNFSNYDCCMFIFVLELIVVQKMPITDALDALSKWKCHLCLL